MQSVEFKRPDRLLMLGLGIFTIPAATVALLIGIFAGRDFDFQTIGMLVLVYIAICALGLGFINAWRTPMLTVQPDTLKIATFFGARSIPISKGQRLGEFHGFINNNTDKSVSARSGRVRHTKAVFFYTMDSKGALVKLIVLNEVLPMIAQIRDALSDVAGLQIETLSRDGSTRQSRPDVAHWRQ